MLNAEFDLNKHMEMDNLNGRRFEMINVATQTSNCTTSIFNFVSILNQTWYIISS